VPKGLDPETGQVEVAQEDVGTKLRITPQITQDGNIVMRVEVERSSIGEEVTIGGAPFFAINKRNATSQVRVKDGETVVIGGLVTTEETENQHSVPFLSKIPILGLMFRNKTESKDFDETMIFITPHVVNSEKG